MKIARLVSATMIASALVLGSTGCSSEINPSKLNPITQLNHEKDVDGIITTLNAALKWPTSERVERLDAVMSETRLSDEEHRDLVKETLSGWTSQFSAADFDEDKDYDYSMNYLTYCIAVFDSADKEITVDVPKDAIKIDGDTAMLERKDITIYLDGVEQEPTKYDADEAFYMDFHFVKENGKWVIKVPEGM